MKPERDNDKPLGGGGIEPKKRNQGRAAVQKKERSEHWRNTVLLEASGAMKCNWPRWKRTGILEVETLKEEEEDMDIDYDQHSWLETCQLPRHNIPSFMRELGELGFFFFDGRDIHDFGGNLTKLFWHVLENSGASRATGAVNKSSSEGSASDGKK